MKGLIFLFAFLLALQSKAGLFRAESETFNSFRENEQHKLEVPLYEFVATSYMTEKRDVEINSNFSFFTDTTGNNTNKAYLYALDAKLVAIPDRLNIKVGRSFDVVNTIGPASVDMVSAELLLLNRQVRLGSFIGVERKLEAYDSDLKSNIYGVRADFRSDDPQSLYLGTKFEQRSNANRSLENRVEVSGRKAFLATWSPEVTVDSESDVNNSNLNRLEAGVDVYPSITTFSKVRVMTYNVLPQTGVQQPIFSIFATGPLYEGRFQFEKKMTSHLTGSFSVFYDDYQLLANQRATGTGGELEGKYFTDEGLRWNDIVYFFQSYGGNAVGNRVGVQTETASKKNEYYGLVDLTYYEKLTSSKRGAYTGEAGWSHLMNQKLKFTLGLQASSNNVLTEDFRSIAKLTYLLWDEI
jgi:hypothetical protein